MRKFIAAIAAIGTGLSVYSCGSTPKPDKPTAIEPTFNSERAAEMLRQFERNSWRATHVPETVTDFGEGRINSIRVPGNEGIARPIKRDPLYSAAEIAASARIAIERLKAETTPEKR